MISMKVHQFARGLWADAHEVVPSNTNSSNNSLALCCKRLRPLAPKLPNSPATSSSPPPPPPPPHNNSLSPFDLKSFIRPESGPRKFDIVDKESCPQVESSSSGSSTHPGGTRWNPTQEQIGILETLYRGGMRTPNAQQIEQITAQLGKFGKIEGKNVFYWFQNHKARERQKLKRNTFIRSPTSPSIQSIPITDFHTTGDEDSTSPYKRKFRSWGFERLVEDNTNNSNYKIINIINCNSSDRLHVDDFDHDQQVRDRTLELFPLHPEGR